MFRAQPVTPSFSFNCRSSVSALPISAFLPLGLLRDLAFDGQRAGVADLVERAQEVLHADVAFAQRHFGAPLLARPRGPLGVLAVDAAHVAADFLQGLDRLARAVEDHVGRVEVDEQVVALDVADEPQQRVGRLLAGLQVQRLAAGRGSGRTGRG